ncbi:hypothetical protein NliqN6_1360 [Naganishia liquefaciens]|uniref:non-specific serine/threonine protein kinase n=1 Tax=Naganishia liquefaciens TaxID=104408 RepID=A0A8H3TPU7_9TREE|nr:hypothetical protein NliqN6_1360 [Naganishia liquefaciens]
MARPTSVPSSGRSIPHSFILPPSAMPFRAPIKSSSSSRRPSSPTPTRPSPTTHDSTCSASTSASETSSLEAAPMRPAPGVNMQEYAGRVGNQARALQPIDTRRDVPHSNGTIADPQSRESSTNRSPLTPRAKSHASLLPHPSSYNSTSASTPPTLPPVLNSALADPETAHLFPSALRPSTSGPDLASLRRRAADERRHTESPLQRPDPTEILGPSPRHRADRPLPAEGPQHHAHSTSPGGGIAMSGSARIDPPGRKAVGLQDFMFGEVIGKGSYSTVILATQKATHLPYAIKILDQYQLVQEKKTKYAKIERDALVRLGPMAGIPKSTTTPHPNGINSARGSRRGSEAEPKAGDMTSTTSRLQAVRMEHSSSMPGSRSAQHQQPVISRKRSMSGSTLKANVGALDIPSREENAPDDLSASQRTVVLDTSDDPAETRPTLPPKSKKRPRLAHPGVVRLHYTFKDDTSLYFVLDLAINGELLSVIKKHGSFDVDSARRYGAQLIDTVEFIHERGVIHRDLKPENILLDDDMRIKVTDFGSAKVLDLDVQPNGPAVEEERKRSFVGTAEYVSPEVLRNEHASFASDIWAYGCILYQLLAGKPPFRGATEYLTFQQVLKAEFEFPEEFDEQAKDLIQQILKLEPGERLDTEGIKAHPFFAGIDFARIWTDFMPEIHTGIKPPAQTTTMSFAWDEFGADAESSENGMQPADTPEQDGKDEYLEAPRRRWIEHGGGAGTFSSGGGTTDDNVDLVGGAGLPSRVSSKEDKPAADKTMLPHRRASRQWTAEDRRSKWSEHFVQGEEIIYQSPILLRSGLLLPKRRTLALTSLPRLICVKEDPATDTIKVQAECLFERPAVQEDTRAAREKDALAKKRLIKRFFEKGPRAFVIQTGEKERVFITDRDDIRARWMEELEKIKSRER